MPLLDHETILRSRIPSITLPSWWRQKVSKYNSKSNNNSDNHDNITNNTGTTRDWRSLSPNNPPLPFVQDSDQGGTISDIYPHTQASERAPKRLPIPKKNRHASFDDDQLQKLSTIIEESDLLTEISLSPKNSSHHRHRHRHQQEERECEYITNISPPSQHNYDKNDDISIIPSPQLPPNDSPHPSSTGSTSPPLQPNDTTFSSIESPSPTNILSSPPSFSNDSTYRSTATATEMTLSSSSSPTSFFMSSLSYPTIWPIHAIAPKYNDNFIPTTVEINAKQELINMIQMVYKFRLDNQSNIPSKMEILFDAQDNVHKIQMWIHDKVQSHDFQGDALYLPPELPVHRTYNCDRVDVWVLGISLYKMLVGRYPFQANNDRRLFSKMQHADFGIPSYLSTDAKDLLRRMLAPDHSRASLDLVMFHPWLKPYSLMIPTLSCPNAPKQSPPSPLETATTTSHAIQQDRSSSIISTNHHYTLPVTNKKKSVVSKLKKLFAFVVQGPCPPPTHPYRDLCPTTPF